MSERKPGWYWVKVGGSWMVMECMGGLWIGPGDVVPHGEFDWMVIGPRIPTPDEHTPPVATRGY